MATPMKHSHKFYWEGMNRSGQKVSGEMAAKNSGVLKAELLKQGVIPQRIRKKSSTLFAHQHRNIKQADIAVFSRQLATMLTSGIPIIKAFDIIARSQNNANLKQLIHRIKSAVESGTNLAEALRQESKYFNPLFCSLVAAGEQSGSLDRMLDNVATYKEKIESIKAKIKKALFYPATILIIAFLVSVALLVFVVPQFSMLFSSFGAELPALTQMVVYLSGLLQAYWWLVFTLLGGSVWGLMQAYRHSEKFAYWLDKISLRIPILGQVLEKSAVARFARTLSITFAAGLPLVDALQSVAGATGNRLYSEATLRIREGISTGQQMHIAMQHSACFPQMVIQMVSVGEESGSLDQMLAKAADFYEAEVDNTVDALSSLLEPVIMAVLGVLVGGLVVAMYLPIFKIGSVI